MEINSFAIKIEKSSSIDYLYIGIGEFSDKVTKAIKNYCVRFCKERDAAIWEMIEDGNKAEKVFLPVWEDELDVELTSRGIAMAPLNLYKTANTKDNIRLTKACLYRNIIRYFRKHGCPCKKNFIGGIEVYIPEKEEDCNWIYQRYSLNIRYDDQIKDGWQLDVSQGSKAVVGKTQVYHQQSLQDEDFNVIAGNMILKKSEINQYHMEKYNANIYPIVNRNISKLLNISSYHYRDTNKYVTKYNGIRLFCDKWINIPDFVDATGIELPHKNSFIQLPAEKIYLVDENAKKLKFGSQQTGISPGYYFKRYGAVERPAEHRHFFICPQSMRNTLWRLFNIFQKGTDVDHRIEQEIVDGNNNLYHTIWLGNHAWADRFNCIFTDDEHALAELKQYLHEKNFEPDKKYFAIIISDIDRDDISSPYHQLYYNMKYLLMKYNIGSQVIYKDRVNNKSFINYMLPNIAAAIAGKEGGKAWKIAYPSQKNDMIIGIGAYKEYGIKQQYIGAAVCLDKEGELNNFDACLKENFEELRTTLINAILYFYGKFEKPSRLIIYYHKKLSHKESDLIEDALRTCQVNCPVIVINVTETGNEDLLAFDSSCPNVLMPVSGTYIHLRTRRGCHEYLLYNNERYAVHGDKMAHLRPFPVKISIMAGRNNKQELTNTDIKEIITLTYQTTRINWKSVSMRSMPITIAYATLVAKFMPHFPDGQLTEFGKNNLWML